MSGVYVAFMRKRRFFIMLKKNAVLNGFDKDRFKNSVLYNVRTLYRKNLDEATPQQIFQAVAYAIKDAVVDNWMTTQQEYEKQDPKTVYYLSMEFLMGRALGNNIINYITIIIINIYHHLFSCHFSLPSFHF